MTPFPIIGICGRARSGKDTVCQMLIELGAARYRYGFADPLRLMLHAGLGIDLAAPEWASAKEDPIPGLGKSPRQLLQTLGTEWGRQLVHPDIWIMEAEKELVSRGPGMAIADVRFQNEADWIVAQGGALISVMGRYRSDIAPHASEAGVALKLGRDAFIVNDGTLDELRDKVQMAWAALVTRTQESRGASETAASERSGRI